MAESTRLIRYRQIDIKTESDLASHYVKTKNGVFVRIDDIRLFDGTTAANSIPTMKQLSKRGQKFRIFKSSLSDSNKYKYDEIVAKEGADSFSLADSTIYEQYRTEDFVVAKFKSASSAKTPAMLEYSAYKTTSATNLGPDKTFIKVRFVGDTVDTVIPVSRLRNEAGETVSVDKVKDLVGKTIKVEGESSELEPLTSEQAKLLERKRFEYESVADEDILRDDDETNTHSRLRLKDGTYVSEKAVVQPKCYNYTDDASTNFDAFLVTDSDGKTYVVDKKYTPSRTPSTVFFTDQEGEHRISFNPIRGDGCNVQKLVRSSGGILNSDVIQTTSYSTTSHSTAFSCEVVNVHADGINLLDAVDADGKKRELAARIKEIYEKFVEDYKAKKYDIGNQVLITSVVDGKVKSEFVNYVLNHRYMVSDVMPSEDFGVSEIEELLRMPENGFQFDGTSLNGGAKYDAKKAIKDRNRIVGEQAADFVSFVLSGGGGLAALVAPLLVIGVGVGLIAKAISNSVQEHKKQRQIESPKPDDNIYPNKNDMQRKKVKESILDQIQKVLADVQEDHEKNPTMSDSQRANKKLNFLEEMKLIEYKLEMLSATKHGSDFNPAEGRVDQSNATEFSNYMKTLRSSIEEIETLKKQIKEYEKIIAKGERSVETNLQNNKDRLKILNAQLENLKSNYHTSGSESELDPEKQELQTMINEVIGFVVIKYFGEEVSVADADKKKELEEFARTTEISIDKKHKKVVYSHEIVKGERSIKRRRAWHSRNKQYGNEFATETVKVAGEVKGNSLITETENSYDILSAVEYTAEALKPEPKPLHDVEELKKPSVEKRTVAGLDANEAEDIIKKVCKAMAKLNEITDAYYGDNDLVGNEETRAKKLVELYEYNENVLKAVLSRPNTKLYKSLHLKYSSQITEAAKRYKDYMTYVEDRTIKTL